MKLLVTGGAGFIGSNFIHYWLKRYPEDSIVNLDKLTYAGNVENLKSLADNPHYSFMQGDICDKKLVQNLIKDVDVIVNFAAETHVDRSISGPNIFIQTNVVGTQTLLEAARERNTRFHHISTDEVYGHLGYDDEPFNEKTPYSPRSPYSASKASSDLLTLAYFKTYSLPVTISNTSNNFGPYQYPEKLIPKAITDLLQGKKVTLMGEGENIRDWIYVEDHCRGIDLIIKKGKLGETYCIGSRQEKTNKEICMFILKEMGYDESMIETIPHRLGHDFRYAINPEKIQRELGWEPKESFEEDMKKTIQWYRENEVWWKPLKAQAAVPLSKTLQPSQS